MFPTSVILSNCENSHYPSKLLRNVGVKKQHDNYCQDPFYIESKFEIQV